MSCKMHKDQRCDELCTEFNSKMEWTMSGSALCYILLICITMVFLLSLLCRKRKLSGFAWVQIFLLTVYNIIAGFPVGGFYYNQMWNGIAGVLYICISLNFAIRYFYSSNIIYQFSKNGHLPTEKSNFRFRLWLILFNLFVFICGSTLVFFLNMAFIHKDFQRARLIFGIGIVLIYIAEIVTVVILGIAILRLVKSRAKACEQG